MPLKKVFLCHSSSDKLFVDRLASDLEKVNIGVWYDKWEIKVGDSLIEKIQEGLESNDYLVIILSNESVRSEWVKRELNSALMREIKEKEIVVLPCRLHDCPIPTFLREKKYADFINSYEDGFTDLLLAILPESKEVAIRSRDFRVIQYLIAGLTSTDSAGSNILNSYQLRKVYPFRKELKGYLGLDEKRLLFYSAVAFKSVNHDTPDIINNNVPVWGLIDEVDDLIRAQWVAEKTNQGIFYVMARYFDWAISVSGGPNIERVKRCILEALRSFEPSQYYADAHEKSKSYLFRLFAIKDSQFFIDDFINQNNISPAVIEASAELPKALDIDYYLHLYRDNKEPEVVASIIKALIKLKEPVAVQILSENYTRMHPGVWNHGIMNMFRAREFGPELRTWLEKCSDLDVKVDIIGALGNCGFNIIDDIDNIIDKYDNIKTNDAALIRIIGCYGNISYAEFLTSKFGNRNTILSEAIIYAIGRLLKEKSIDYINNWYETEDSNLIKAAAIETIARYDNEVTDNKLENILYYKNNLYMLSALIRATEITKSIKWKDYLPQLFNHPSLLIRLCAARSASVMADYEYAMDVLDGNYDNIIKSIFDEKLYCREPFRPQWLSHPYHFDIELARLSIRLTWPDQPIVHFQYCLDTNRFLSKELLQNEY